MKYGIKGHKAEEFKIAKWVDDQGREITPLHLTDFEGKFKVLYCFQSWCPGCHSRGLPALQQIIKALKDKEDVAFIAMQTVFEGFEANTYEKMLEVQQQYNLEIPFAHDPGDSTSNNRSYIMYHYRTGGTPWFIFIDKTNTVVFNDFHLDVEKTIEFLNKIE